MVREFAKLVRNHYTATTKSQNPQQFRKALKNIASYLCDGDQHDSHELLVILSGSGDFLELCTPRSRGRAEQTSRGFSENREQFHPSISRWRTDPVSCFWEVTGVVGALQGEQRLFYHGRVIRRDLQPNPMYEVQKGVSILSISRSVCTTIPPSTRCMSQCRRTRFRLQSLWFYSCILQRKTRSTSSIFLSLCRSSQATQWRCLICDYATSFVFSRIRSRTRMSISPAS